MKKQRDHAIQGRDWRKKIDQNSCFALLEPEFI